MVALLKTTWMYIAVFVLIADVGQAMSGGSGYSRYGIGDIRYFASGRSMGMGGANLAILDFDEVNRMNPAAWTSLKRTSFSGTFSYEGFATTDGVSSAFLSAGEFGGAMFAVPIAPSRGLVVAGGFNPYSSVNYDVATDGVLSGIAYDVRYTGEGGLSHAMLGFSYLPTSSLHLGILTQYLFGTIENSWRTDFASTSYSRSEAQRTTDLRGFQFTFGFIESGVGSWIGLSERHQLSFGGIITTPVDLTVERQTTYSHISQDSISAPLEGIASIPVRLGVGAAMTIDGRYLIGTDVSFQDWSRYEEIGYHPTELRNSFRWSIGAERLPARQPTSFGSRVAYRLGFNYNATYYRVKNESLNELFIAGGIGFPLGPEARLNVAVEYGFRGTTANQLQEDNIVRFMVTLNIGELWFVRPPEE